MPMPVSATVKTTSPSALRRSQDFATGKRVLQRVVEQVLQHFGETAAVAGDIGTPLVGCTEMEISFSVARCWAVSMQDSMSCETLTRRSRARGGPRHLG